jgi:hypothetical protein
MSSPENRWRWRWPAPYKSERVCQVLEGLFVSRGKPAELRMDNGPEFVALALKGLCHRHGVNAAYIEPGKPCEHSGVVSWQNGFAESFVSRLRDEFLDGEVFLSVMDAQVRLAIWRRYYNEERLHSSIGYRTPKEFAASWLQASRESSKEAAKTKEFVGTTQGGQPRGAMCSLPLYPVTSGFPRLSSIIVRFSQVCSLPEPLPKMVKKHCVIGLLRLPELGALEEGVRETWVCPRQLLDLGKVHREVVLQQMLQKARGDSVAQIQLGVTSPGTGELPYGFRVGLDVLPDGNDGLPAWVRVAFSGSLTRQQSFSVVDSLVNAHG